MLSGMPTTAGNATARRSASARASSGSWAIRTTTDQHVLCRAPQSHNGDAYAPLHAADECVLKESREPRLRGRTARDVLQFRPRASNIAWEPGDGSWCHDAALGDDRYRRHV